MLVFLLCIQVPTPIERWKCIFGETLGAGLIQAFFVFFLWFTYMDHHDQMRSIFFLDFSIQFRFRGGIFVGRQRSIGVSTICHGHCPNRGGDRVERSFGRHHERAVALFVPTFGTKNSKVREDGWWLLLGVCFLLLLWILFCCCCCFD